KTLVVDKAGPSHYGKPSEGQKLLSVNRMIQETAVTQIIGNAAAGPVLILELISHRGPGPASFRVVALIVEAGAVDVGDGVEGSIDLVARGSHTRGLIDGLTIRAVH